MLIFYPDLEEQRLTPSNVIWPGMMVQAYNPITQKAEACQL